jgi:transcriptional regulator with XRE-family HTH domain
MRWARFERELTLGGLMVRTGINQARLSQIERRIFTPTPKEKALIAKALEAPQEKIFPEE